MLKKEGSKLEGLQKHFNKFLEKIDLDKIPYIDHIMAIEECLTRLSFIKFARRLGSTKRGTSVNSKSDVDFIVIFNRAKNLKLVAIRKMKSEWH